MIDAFLNPLNMVFGFLRREIIRLAVYLLEFTAVDGYNHIGEHLHLPAEVNEGPTSIFDTFTVIFSEVGNGFKVRR